jgi:hypothetical protein
MYGLNDVLGTTGNTGIPVHTCTVHTTVVHVYTRAWEMGAWVHVVPGTHTQVVVVVVRRYLSAQVYLTVVSCA